MRKRRDIGKYKRKEIMKLKETREKGKERDGREFNEKETEDK